MWKWNGEFARSALVFFISRCPNQILCTEIWSERFSQYRTLSNRGCNVLLVTASLLAFPAGTWLLCSDYQHSKHPTSRLKSVTAMMPTHGSVSWLFSPPLWISCHEIWYRHLCSQEDEPYWLCWFPDFTSRTTMKLTVLVLSEMFQQLVDELS